MLLSAGIQHIAQHCAWVGWIPSDRLAGPMLYTTQITLKGQLLLVPSAPDKGCALGQDQREVWAEHKPLQAPGNRPDPS